MILSGKSYQKIVKLLEVSPSFISKWKNQAIFSGVESLRLQYKGTQSYLKPEEKVKGIQWLREQEYLASCHPASEKPRYEENRKWCEDRGIRMNSPMRKTTKKSQ